MQARNPMKLKENGSLLPFFAGGQLRAAHFR